MVNAELGFLNIQLEINIKSMLQLLENKFKKHY